MNGKEHLFVGLAAAAPIAALDQEAAIPILAAAALGSLMPDLDCPGTLSRRLMGLFTALGAIAAAPFIVSHELGATWPPELPTLPPAIPIAGGLVVLGIRMLRHRGPTHTVEVALAAAALAALAMVLANRAWPGAAGLGFGPVVALALLIGYLSHLVADRHVRSLVLEHRRRHRPVARRR